MQVIVKLDIVAVLFEVCTSAYVLLCAFDGRERRVGRTRERETGLVVLDRREYTAGNGGCYPRRGASCRASFSVFQILEDLGGRSNSLYSEDLMIWPLLCIRNPKIGLSHHSRFTLP